MNISAPRHRFTRLLASVNGDGRYGLGLAAALGILLGVALLGEPAMRLLRYERGPIAAGEAWRLLSAHLVHLDLEHAALNSLGALLMWALFARDFSALRWGVILLASAASIDAGFWLLDPTLEWYVGSSGVLHGVLAAGTVAHLRRGDLDGWILVGFLVLKLAWEQWQGPLPFSGTHAPVVVDAHLYGAVGGGLCALFMRSRSESL